LVLVGSKHGVISWGYEPAITGLLNTVQLALNSSNHEAEDHQQEVQVVSAKKFLEASPAAKVGL
jgi:hypothetical protein